MIARVPTATVYGIDGIKIDVEVDITYGLPAFNMVGLPETSVKESKERVRSAIKNAGFEFPGDRITINLAPADVRKEGSSFDLPIAVGILAVMKAINAESLRDHLIAGELSLDGRVKAGSRDTSYDHACPRGKDRNYYRPGGERQGSLDRTQYRGPRCGSPA